MNMTMDHTRVHGKGLQTHSKIFAKVVSTDNFTNRTKLHGPYKLPNKDPSS